MITARTCTDLAVTVSDVLIAHDHEENIICTATSRLKNSIPCSRHDFRYSLERNVGFTDRTIASVVNHFFVEL
jgi:hypothetical protein